MFSAERAGEFESSRVQSSPVEQGANKRTTLGQMSRRSSVGMFAAPFIRLWLLAISGPACRTARRVEVEIEVRYLPGPG